ncbi:MAG TPA: methyltransferase domain-containing protein [Clostridiales bacterium]|jgi:trans-aconitate 2-methyltransferase|nr:methyltransferase domain-containing protein [Clostridiales bacterium]
MADWNSAQYLKYEKERTQPAIDLANRISLDNPKRIIDVGCGPGNSTRVLASKFSDAYILGVDKSENMISSAKMNYPNLDFKLCDISSEISSLDRDFDIVFSNACIQWVPNHKILLKELVGLLSKGGILAIQIPMNYNEPIHRIIKEVSASQKWKEHFSNPRIFYTLSPGEYFDILSEISDYINIWETVYYHTMGSHNDIMEWYRGTGLRPYLDVLEDEKKAEFENEIMERIIESYPKQKNGQIIFRFPRLFFTAY